MINIFYKCGSAPTYGHAVTVNSHHNNGEHATNLFVIGWDNILGGNVLERDYTNMIRRSNLPIAYVIACRKHILAVKRIYALIALIIKLFLRFSFVFFGLFSERIRNYFCRACIPWYEHSESLADLPKPLCKKKKQVCSFPKLFLLFASGQGKPENSFYFLNNTPQIPIVFSTMHQG